METRARSIFKALTWRVTALVITVSVAWALTDRPDLAITIGLADTSVKLLAYYGHERAWLKVRYGRLRPPDYQI